jgi:hypothetical protein
MAIVTNTFQSTSAKGNREQLADVVERVTPEDTPIHSMVKKGTVKGVNPEWETDDLAAPASNVQLEGDDYAFGATTPAVRVGNYTQILRKEGIVSGSQDALENAGRVEQVKYQKLKKAVELRKDVEFAILSNSASVGGATRVMGGLPSWYTTNVSRGASGSNGGFNSGTRLTVAATNGTQRAFTKVMLDNVMQQGYTSGANYKFVSVSPYVKSVFVSFISDTATATFRYAVTDGKENSIISNADYYEGPFGRVMVVPNRVQAGSAVLARNAHFIDPEYLGFDWFRPIQEDKDVAKTGDAQKFVLLGEGTLRVKNEKGLGVAADLFGLTAST